MKDSKIEERILTIPLWTNCFDDLEQSWTKANSKRIQSETNRMQKTDGICPQVVGLGDIVLNIPAVKNRSIQITSTAGQLSGRFVILFWNLVDPFRPIDVTGRGYSFSDRPEQQSYLEARCLSFKQSQVLETAETLDLNLV